MSKNQTLFSGSTHLDSLGVSFRQMVSERKFVDVTLVCDGRQIHCHRVFLAACSSYFAEILEENPAQHPIIILPRDVPFRTIQSLLDYMYQGEVSVEEEDFENLLRCADLLQIHGITRGISKVDEEKEINICDEIKTEDPELLNTSPLPVCFETESPEKSSHEEENHPKINTERTHSGNNMSSAIMSVKRGMSIMNACKIYNIPPGTLYMSMKKQPKKTQITSKTTPPSTFLKHFNQNHPYNPTDVWNALISIKGGMSPSESAKIYKIPKMMLLFYARRHGIKFGHPKKGKTSHK